MEMPSKLHDKGALAWSGRPLRDWLADFMHGD